MAIITNGEKHQWQNVPMAKNPNGKTFNGKIYQWQKIPPLSIQMAQDTNGKKK